MGERARSFGRTAGPATKPEDAATGPDAEAPEETPELASTPSDGGFSAIEDDFPAAGAGSMTAEIGIETAEVATVAAEVGTMAAASRAFRRSARWRFAVGMT